MHSHGRGARRSGGFTLAELLTVLALLGVVGTVATVRVTRRTRDDAARGLTRQVHTRLVQARFAAVASGTRVLVRLRPGPARVALQLQTALRPGLAPPPPGDGFGPVSDEIRARPSSQIVTVAATVDGAGPPPPSAGDAELVFFPDGRAQLRGLPPHPGATIYLADDRGEHRHRITVLGRTGFARVVDN